MRTPTPVVLVVFGLALGVTVPAYAKRPIQKITISRPGVAGALEVTEKEAMAHAATAAWDAQMKAVLHR